jgi:hypothetical protein
MMCNREHAAHTCHAVALAESDPYEFAMYYDV